MFALLAINHARIKALCQDTRCSIVNAKKNGFVRFVSQEKGFTGKISYLYIISRITVQHVWQVARSNRVAYVNDICLIQEWLPGPKRHGAVLVVSNVLIHWLPGLSIVPVTPLRMAVLLGGH